MKKARGVNERRSEAETQTNNFQFQLKMSLVDYSACDEKATKN